MRIAISSNGIGIESEIERKFERCHFFLIFDIEKNILLPMENKAKDQPHEIGGVVGQLIEDQEIDAVITTDIGPSAFEIFEGDGIKIYRAEGLIEEAIQQLKKGELPEITEPTVPLYPEWKKKNLEKSD